MTETKREFTPSDDQGGVPSHPGWVRLPETDQIPIATPGDDASILASAAITGAAESGS